jgi:nitroimidazol reductase NimA-like FMN-containing flavoprotein (pyridoxamine 5'-phosphate oxidase superfamily)
MGAKLENMGANVLVCVEVDHIQNAADWRSVIEGAPLRALVFSQGVTPEMRQ